MWVSLPGTRREAISGWYRTANSRGAADNKDVGADFDGMAHAIAGVE